MRRSARKMLVFGVKLFLVLFLFAAIWPYLAPPYNLIVATTATWLAPLTSTSAKVTKVTADLITLDLYFSRFPHVKIEYEYEGYFHANLGLLLALIVATFSLRSLRSSQTLRIVLLALSFIIAFHVLFLFIASTIVDPCVRSVFPCSGQAWYRWLDRLMAIGKNFFPILVWALLTWRVWLPKPVAHTVQRKPKETRP